MKVCKFQYVLSDLGGSTEVMPEDFEINDRVSLLFLSLTYHLSYPLYIQTRLDELYKKRKGKNRYLLVLSDHADE